MGKAIQYFLVVNLLLGMTVLGLGSLVFKDRGVVKARALLLEQNAARIAQNLNWGAPVEWEEGAAPNPTGTYNVPQPSNAAELSGLSSNLEELARFTTTRIAQLNQRYVELVQTRKLLADTEDTLRTRENELATTRSQVATIEQTLATTQNELREANRNIDTLRTEKSSLEARVTEINNQLTDLNNRIAGQEVDLDAIIQDRDQAIARYEACRVGAAGGTRNVKTRGTSATVLAVNPDWNFVIINKGTAQNVEPFTDALLHRGNQYIGRVTVMRVEDDLSVAEIHMDSLVEGTSIVVGDTLFF